VAAQSGGIEDNRMNMTVIGRVLITALFLGVSACGATDQDSGFSLEAHARDSATAADVGLPAYPGAIPFTDHGDSSPSANLGVSTPLFGVQVIAVKMQTSDKPQQVATFYRKALAKYGTVIECRDGEDASPEQDDNELHCEDHDTDEDSIVYKVGSKDDFRIAATKPHGSGSEFSLVHVALSGAAR
jgi:hypothetical protein